MFREQESDLKKFSNSQKNKGFDIIKKYLPILKNTLKSTAISLLIMIISGVCEFAIFFLLVNISFIPTLLSQSISTLAGLAGKFLSSKSLRYKDGFSAYKIKTQFPKFLAATLFLVGAGNLLLSIFSLFIDFILISKALVSAITAVSGALIYKHFVFK